MIKMLVFDMAGTTVDEDNVVYKTLRKVVNDAGCNFSLDEVLAIGAGKEKLQAIKDLLKSSDNAQEPGVAEKLYAVFDKALSAAYDSITVAPQPGAEELFRVLRKNNVIVVLNTGYNRATASSLLEKLHWAAGTDIDDLITATDVSNNRPQPDMIQLAMQRFSISDPKEVVKVGDSIIDIEEGQNAGCGFNIGITTGAHTAEQLKTAAPDHIIGNLMELPGLLNLTA